MDEGVRFNLGTTLPTIPARRVQLRWLTDKDVPALFTIFSDPDITRYWGHSGLAEVSAATALLEAIHEKFAQKQLFQWGVALCDSDTLIGTCTLASLNPENRRAELGFALARAFWGHGYINEALRALLQFGFFEMRLHRLSADTDPRNERSIRNLERLGFRREGYLREHYLVNGETQDSILYGLLRSEWQKLSS